jgi:hypothetical protein
MDFVERWFAISPDGGSGIFEVAVILIPTTIAFSVLFLRALQNAWQQRMHKIAWLK